MILRRPRAAEPGLPNPGLPELGNPPLAEGMKKAGSGSGDFAGLFSRTMNCNAFSPRSRPSASILIVALLTGLIGPGFGSCASGQRPRAGLGSAAELVLEPIARLGPGARKEISGIVRSRRDSTVFWTHNDSGDEPRIYPVRTDGSVVASERYPETPGTLVGGAINCDWEDIALDASGQIIIADFGNNSNSRRDLALYFVEEPEVTEGRTSVTSKVLIRYPDQATFPAPRGDFNFDAEALFTVGDDVFVLTKHRSDTFTKLYRLDGRESGVLNPLTYLESFDIGGKVTGADASTDGLKLVILTYDRIWLFERDSAATSFFAGRCASVAYRMKDGPSDSEAICFENERCLLIADEAKGSLYRVDLNVLERLPQTFRQSSKP